MDRTKEEIDTHTIRVEDVNAPCSLIDVTIRQNIHNGHMGFEQYCQKPYRWIVLIISYTVVDIIDHGCSQQVLTTHVFQMYINIHQDWPHAE